MAVVSRKPETLTETIGSSLHYYNSWSRVAHCLRLLVRAKVTEQIVNLNKKAKKVSRSKSKTWLSILFLAIVSPFLH